ncbi:MAG: 2-phosphosulfolactate phosphatase [Acidimicrobiales bacterium]
MVAELHTDDGTAGARDVSFCTQDGFAYRFDWGPNGLRTLAPLADVVVIVDVLRFTSAVSAAIESGCTVFPYRWADDGAAAYAAERDAVLAGRRELGELSLSPTGLLALDAPVRLVLPSPNGSALSFAARDHGARHVLAGCLRNATATARAARRLAGPTGVIAVIAAGERWHGATGPLRPAVEDLLGAGAVLAALDPAAAISAPCCSPEAAAARAAFVAARPRLHDVVAASASGRELAGRGWDDDVAAAAALDVTDVVARLVDDAFVRG